MSDRLYNTLQLPSLAPGATSAPVAHNLHAHGIALMPDMVACPGCSVASVDDTNISVTNIGEVAFAPQVMVQHMHSITRALGITGGGTDPTIQPFVLSGASAPVPASLVGTTGLRLTRVAGTVQAYVDGVNGLDTNDGLTPATALQTIPRIYDLFPWRFMSGAKLAVNLAGVGGFGAAATAQLTYSQASIYAGGGDNIRRPPMYFVGPEMVPLTLAAGSSAPTLDATPTTIVGQTDVADPAAFRTRFLFTAPGWTTADMRSKAAFIRVTRGGTKVLWELPVADNGTDRLWVDTPVPVGNVLPTDTVEIVTPGVLLAGDSDDPTYVGVMGSEAYIPTTIPATFTRVGFSRVYLLGMGTTLDRCSATNVGILGRAGVRLLKVTALGGLLVDRTGYLYGMASVTTVGAPTYSTPRVDVACRGVFVYGSFQPLYNVGAYGSNDSGINVDGGALETLSSTTTLSGSGNGAYGIACLNHGYAKVRGGTKLTMTGTSGDIRLDAAQTIPYGTGVGGFEEAAGFNGNAHRIGGSTTLVPLGKFGHIYTA